MTDARLRCLKMSSNCSRFHALSIAILLVVPLLPLAARCQTVAVNPAVEQVKPATAAEVYQALGAPSDPKVDAHWNRYHDHAQASELLKALAAVYPQLAKLESLGKSIGGREMWVMTITDPAGGAEQDKAGFWLDGGIHANEVQTVEVSLYTAWFLLESHGRNETVTRLLRERVFYIAPMLSPDSRDAHMREPNTTHSPRGGQRPVDDDRDGLVDEDLPDDLNGDGNINEMRVRDPNGRWKPHPDNAQWLVPTKPGERGSYTLLGPEGVDNDGDGAVNEDGNGYYDPNRNWGWNWQPEYVQGGAHRYPFSIEENRLMADFVRRHPNIAGAQTVHNSGGMILRGPGAKDDQYEPADVGVYDEIARRGEEILPGYRYMNVAHDLYEVYGGELDWFYGTQGIFSYTTELFPAFNFFRKPSEEYFGKEEELHRFNKYLLLDQGWIPWKEVEHPQYGKVEVGGFRKNWVRQPPSFLLEEECHRNMAFAIYHADQMPLVKIDQIVTRSLPGDLLEITATIVNDRLTPTHAAVDVRNRITAPDMVSIEGAGGQVLLGMTADNLLFQDPAEQAKLPNTLKIKNISGSGVVYARWLVSGNAEWRVKVRSIKGGTAEKLAPAASSP